MNKLLTNVFFIVAICVLAYLIFNNLNFREGMETNTTSSDSNAKGVAGGAQSYSAAIKSMTIKNQDVLLVSKYRTDYENTVLNLDDLINTMMLQTTLSIDTSKPMDSLEKLVKLNSAKSALNNVMKYIDSTS
uniref:Uncharacterized protein n=1 Tax=viral metagenome TaxID=1070528 RepID=A0A6C0DIS9_9ZZZZ